MATQQISLIAPLASPLPPPPEGDALTKSQWMTLMAIGDTILPNIDSSSDGYHTVFNRLRDSISQDVDSVAVSSYLSESASSIPELRECLHRILGEHIRQDAKKGISAILSALDTRAGCLLMTGYTTSFRLHPLNVREQIIHNWQQSYLPPLRGAAKAFTTLFKAVWSKTSPTLGPILGFPRAPVHGNPGKGHDYNFIQLPPGEDPEIIETDVVIIGSGCGGAVCAKNLSEAGLKVLVVEKAYHYPPEHLPMREIDGGYHLFQNGGTEVSDDNSITVLAGQAWGGGGTVNWSASLQTQSFVRQEWADAGLTFFTSPSFQTSLDRVCSRMGVSADHIEHNKTNRVLLDGARKLGYSVKPVPQNTGGKQHYCGYCTYGCGSAEKQGPVVSFLPDAHRAGARFMEGFQADKILFDTNSVGKKIATGVKGTWHSRDSHGGVNGPNRMVREVLIRAKRLIVSCGTLQSPLLLLRSGLTNPQIGRNLHLHPATVLGAIYDEEVRPWEGGILTAVVDAFQDLDGHGHGAKLEATTMVPSMFVPLLPWTSGAEFKIMAARLRDMVGYISLVRDRDTGRVFPDPVDGRCRISYSPSAFDRKHALQGLEALAKICYVDGAREIFTMTTGLPTFVRQDVPEGEPDPGINDERFQAWLAAMRKKGLSSSDTPFASAHQMGTCKMGVSEKESVVDLEGRVWGTEGLFVADASVFPSASGVNPMVTNMAISDYISRGVAKDLVGKRVVDGARL